MILSTHQRLILILYAYMHPGKPTWHPLRKRAVCKEIRIETFWASNFLILGVLSKQLAYKKIKFYFHFHTFYFLII